MTEHGKADPEVGNGDFSPDKLSRQTAPPDLEDTENRKRWGLDGPEGRGTWVPDPRDLAALNDTQIQDLADLGMMDSEPARRGVAWLVSAQNADGGWGGAANTPSSVEETALAVEVLLDAAPQAAERGLAWLVERIEAGGLHYPTPIGFYFAKLWYYEKLYPIVFSVAALGRARRKLAAPDA